MEIRIISEGREQSVYSAFLTPRATEIDTSASVTSGDAPQGTQDDTEASFRDALYSLLVPEQNAPVASTGPEYDADADAMVEALSGITYDAELQRLEENGVSGTVPAAEVTTEIADHEKAASYGTVMTYDEIFSEASQKYGVDKNLLTAVAKVESAFTPDAVSSSGAVGIMQLMPATAQAMEVSDSYDPYQNIMGGAKLLSVLMKKYNNDTTLALAAYNAGGGAVDRAGGVPSAGVQRYVDKVLSNLSAGVTVPDRQVVVDHNTGISSAAADAPTSSQSAAESMKKAQTAARLRSMLSDFPDHPTYSAFVTLMERGLEEANREPVDASKYSSPDELARERMFTTANKVVSGMIRDLNTVIEKTES